jgi:site-specific recombinase XerC
MSHSTGRPAHVRFGRPVKSPAPLTRPGHGTEGASFDAKTTLQRRRLVALMRDLRHEQAVAFGELADWIAFLDVEGKSPITLYSYTREIALLLREYPTTRFDEFTAEQINAVLTLKPLRSRYITRSILNGWFNWGVEQDKVVRSPMRKVAKPKQPKRRPKDIYTEAEIAALEALPSPDGALCAILFGAGIRKAGARNLQVKDIDLDRKRMEVTEKGNKTRPVPLPAYVCLAIADLFLLEGINPNDYLWYSRPGGRSTINRSRPIASTTFDRWWGGDPTRNMDGVCQRAGVRRLNVHQTRHSYGHRLREKGIDLELRKELMGHENIKTTDHYYGTVTVEDAAAAIEEAW